MSITAEAEHDTGPSVDRHVDPLVHEAINGLRQRNPAESASTNLTDRQIGVVFSWLALVVLGLALFPRVLIVGHIALITAVYSVVVAYRVILHGRSFDAAALIQVPDELARATPDSDLPRYTVLVPCYREPAVVADLVRALGALEYPADKLEIMLLLEADDRETVDAVLAIDEQDRLGLEMVLVPAADPRTKPKALNYGIQLAQGELVTVFDAEDRPDPLQLRRAAYALANGGPELACVQAQLCYANAWQNLLTRWFNLEYIAWFAQFLPALSQSGSPVPLGGTSNHFRRSVLAEVGGWDPFNVTEDADLGLRLHRRGYRTGVLNSITWEEANSDFVNWIKQRSRWYKGYLQTWAVHLRHPVTLYRELGAVGFIEFNLFVGGTPLLALLNPVFWFTTLAWFLLEPPFIEALLPFPLYHISLVCWLGGNFTLTYLNLLIAEQIGEWRSHRAALLTPLYWVMMSMAAYKAAVQFLFQPSKWEKTVHGLAPRQTAEVKALAKAS
ncbi:MAG: glycosyltransferase family 2 protein [Acidimicrobiales bacterium]